MTLTEPHASLRSLVRTIEDPYYSKASHHYHQDVLSPSFDVRESNTAIFLEGEFPGVARKEDITIEKLGPRTLLVESKVARFNVEAEWGQSASSHLGTIQGGNLEQQQPQGTSNRRIISEPDEGKGDWQNFTLAESKEERGEERGRGDSLHCMLGERHVGHLQRSFTFPCAVDIEALKARLRNGLLVIMVPKIKDGKKDSKKIEIED
jgi:HSP20 family protein